MSKMATDPRRRRQEARRRNSIRQPIGKDLALNSLSRVGFFSCSVLDARGEWPIVRVAEREPAKRPKASAMIACPCGNEHRVGLMWRGLNPDEDPSPRVWI